MNMKDADDHRRKGMRKTEKGMSLYVWFLNKQLFLWLYYLVTKEGEEGSQIKKGEPKILFERDKRIGEERNKIKKNVQITFSFYPSLEFW